MLLLGISIPQYVYHHVQLLLRCPFSIASLPQTPKFFDAGLGLFWSSSLIYKISVLVVSCLSLNNLWSKLNNPSFVPLYFHFCNKNSTCLSFMHFTLSKSLLFSSTNHGFNCFHKFTCWCNNIPCSKINLSFHEMWEPLVIFFYSLGLIKVACIDYLPIWPVAYLKNGHKT